MCLIDLDSTSRSPSLIHLSQASGASVIGSCLTKYLSSTSLCEVLFKSFLVRQGKWASCGHLSPQSNIYVLVIYELCCRYDETRHKTSTKYLQPILCSLVNINLEGLCNYPRE